MSKLSIQLNQDYKSYKNGFNTTLEGELIIISGVNGSGKSQLIDIISKREGHHSKRLINSTIKLNDQEISVSEVIHRSYKENINVPVINRAGAESIFGHKNQAWNAYKNYQLNINHQDLWDYKKSVTNTKNLLINEFGAEKFNSNQITQEDFREKLPNDFTWTSDDIFTSFIGDLFFNYTCGIYHAKAKAGESGEKYDPSTSPISPWEELNNLFNDLGFEYRFKNNYYVEKFQINEQPRLYQITNNGNIDEKETRKLTDLSDGEKAIIALSFASLSGVKPEDRKVLLLDEFDANYNPSLTEMFYKIIQKYFISKGILVIIATHSSTTISLAPENTAFYEIFKQRNSSSRILSVQRNQYSDLQIANKAYHDKVTNQKERIKELERENKILTEVKQAREPALIVEDTYDQIYKIAWLKLNDIEYLNVKIDIDEKFNQNSKFKIHSQESANAVAGLLRTNNTDIYKDKKIIGLFDFDKEGSQNFYHLKKGKKGWSDEILGELNTGFYKKRNDHDCFYTMLLPIPNRLKEITSDIVKGKFENYVEIENLLSDNFLTSSGYCNKEEVLGRKYLKIKKHKKNKIWKKLKKLDKKEFKDFTPLFTKAAELFDI